MSIKDLGKYFESEILLGRQAPYKFSLQATAHSQIAMCNGLFLSISTSSNLQEIRYVPVVQLKRSGKLMLITLLLATSHVL